MAAPAIAYTIPALADAGALAGPVLLEISQLSTTVTYTASTISADAAANTFSDSAGGFLSAGFVIGMTIQSSGWLGGGSANNKRARTITAISANTMTFAGADGDDIAATAAGAAVTLTAWLSRALDLADLPPADAADVPYAPGTLADWDGEADPGNVAPALDQLAARVADLETAPGPAADAVGYTPADNTDWDGDADPGSAADALDQLAARLTGLEAVDPVAVFAGFFPGAPGADALLLVHPVVVDATLRANLAGCRVEAEVAATATTVLTLKRGATTIGTATFAAAGTVATLATTGGVAQAVSAGSDKLFLIAPTTPDSTLANVSFALLADR